MNSGHTGYGRKEERKKRRKEEKKGRKEERKNRRKEERKKTQSVKMFCPAFSFR